MMIAQTIGEIREKIKVYKSSGHKVGFVPTMGFLHEGHLSLVRAAKRDCDKVVVSIFVNPTQFAAGEDLEKYPRDIEGDNKLLESEGVDLLFVPSVDEIYPGKEVVYVDVGELGTILCGKYRTAHFRGVTTVVAKLFNIVQPDAAYFGQKDYQQAVIIQKMVKDLNFSVEVKVTPIVREPDGLAMSSRNMYLSPEERNAAAVIYKALKAAETEIFKGETNPKKVKTVALAVLQQEPLCKLQYLEIVDHRTLQPFQNIINKTAAILIAAYLGKTRLIDNTVKG